MAGGLREAPRPFVQSLPRYLFSLNGRIDRVHYWILVVAGLAIVLVAATIGSLNLNNEPIQWLSYAILLSSSLPILSATIRRLHDLNISAVYIMLFMIITGLMQLVSVLGGRLSPIIGAACAALSVMAFVALGVIPGRGKPNRYGP
jgi:uncharacterized membrane protein YhaH (DUF805 family)